MTKNSIKQIEVAISDVDSVYHFEMLLAQKEEDFWSKKNDISDRIYSLYANDKPNEQDNADFSQSFNWLMWLFYQSNENISLWDKNWAFDEHSILFAKRYGMFYLSKGEQFKLVSPGDFVSSTSFPHQEKSVDLRIKRLELLDNSWFYFRGNKQMDTSLLTRIYFHFNYDFKTISAFSKDLYEELNNWFIPFEYKFFARQTNRWDTGVLYSIREHYFVVFYLVKKIASNNKYADLFKEETPYFTKVTALKGIGFAETPPAKNTSFGKYRADILADIYIDFYRNSINKIKAPTLKSYVKRRLLEMGFDIKDFFRNQESCFPYDFSILNKNIILNRIQKDQSLSNYLNWAFQIGVIITKQAIIIAKKGKSHCCWFSLIEDETGNFEYRLTDDSYIEGRLGIIFFLAKLYGYFPNEYIFKFICRTVLKDIRRNKKYSPQEEQTMIKIEKHLKIRVSVKPDDNKQKSVSDYQLTHEIYQILNAPSSYSKLNNEAPQPVLNKGYSAIGLMLLAIHESKEQDLNHLSDYYSKETLMKIINQVKF